MTSGVLKEDAVEALHEINDQMRLGSKTVWDILHSHELLRAEIRRLRTALTRIALQTDCELTTNDGGRCHDDHSDVEICTTVAAKFALETRVGLE